MYKSYITTDAETQVVTGKAFKVILQVNAALTGTIAVIDGISGATANVATITNPTVGSRYVYLGFKDGVRVKASGACNITVSAHRDRRGI